MSEASPPPVEPAAPRRRWLGAIQRAGAWVADTLGQTSLDVSIVSRGDPAGTRRSIASGSPMDGAPPLPAGFAAWGLAAAAAVLLLWLDARLTPAILSAIRPVQPAAYAPSAAAPQAPAAPQSSSAATPATVPDDSISAPAVAPPATQAKPRNLRRRTGSGVGPPPVAEASQDKVSGGATGGRDISTAGSGVAPSASPVPSGQAAAAPVPPGSADAAPQRLAPTLRSAPSEMIQRQQRAVSPIEQRSVSPIDKTPLPNGGPGPQPQAAAPAPGED